IVHRDVSPSNVIVTHDGSVKLLDFGIARSSARSRKTGYGGLKGKVPYMSPEQCRGDALDRRTDIFSLGVLMYEVTLCQRLFVGANDFQIMKAIVGRPVLPPRVIDPSYPPALESVVLRALRKQADGRYATVEE